jgi:hypothetical protein
VPEALKPRRIPVTNAAPTVTAPKLANDAEAAAQAA